MLVAIARKGTRTVLPVQPLLYQIREEPQQSACDDREEDESDLRRAVVELGKHDGHGLECQVEASPEEECVGRERGDDRLCSQKVWKCQSSSGSEDGTYRLAG